MLLIMRNLLEFLRKQHQQTALKEHYLTNILEVISLVVLQTYLQEVLLNQLLELLLEKQQKLTN